MLKDMDPEAMVYAIVAAVFLVFSIALIVAWYRESKSADTAHAARKAAVAELVKMRRRYASDVNEHYDRTYPRWTRPGPPADDTVIMPAVDQTAILPVVPAQTLVMTANGTPLNVANVL